MEQEKKAPGAGALEIRLTWEEELPDDEVTLEGLAEAMNKIADLIMVVDKSATFRLEVSLSL